MPEAPTAEHDSLVDPRTPPGGLDIPEPLDCPRCGHRTAAHWPDVDLARSGCHAEGANPGAWCSCPLTAEQVVAATVLERIQTVVDVGVAPPPPRTSMAVAVKADLEAMPVRPGGINRSMRALAMYLAEAVDGSDSPSTTARLAQELRVVLDAIARIDDSVDDEVAAFEQSLGTPERAAS